MDTSRLAWIGYTIAVVVTTLASAFTAFMLIAYKGRWPESIHSLVSLCLLITIIVGPILAIFGLIAASPIRHSGPFLPRFARVAIGVSCVTATCVLAGLVFTILATILN